MAGNASRRSFGAFSSPGLIFLAIGSRQETAAVAASYFLVCIRPNDTHWIAGNIIQEHFAVMPKNNWHRCNAHRLLSMYSGMCKMANNTLAHACTTIDDVYLARRYVKKYIRSNFTRFVLFAWPITCCANMGLRRH